MNDALFAARQILAEVTPLKTDCGRLCASACCASLEGEETGMLLFPGEDALYENRPGWRLRPTETGSILLICSGRCIRSERPLSCRMFPLLPLPAEGGIRVRMDLRAQAVCPLSRMSVQAMDSAFVTAVRQAGEKLLADRVQHAFLERLSAEQAELRALKRQFDGFGKG